MSQEAACAVERREDRGGTGSVEHRIGGAQDRWSTGSVEHRIGGAQDRWSTGSVEHRIGGASEAENIEMAHLLVKILTSHFQEHEDGLVLHADVAASDAEKTLNLHASPRLMG
ncbi:hypothetical protein G5714_017982 [Onychostoma macrolepis]|uniref:Uncharacterized protein n=1 Tax=Onychostoma macrolepis TaxID=369639 RepID=A0A7J6C2T8_9TELE|nr:hypothetical protein G5714_017982 [Onychostoma macrolepis]